MVLRFSRRDALKGMGGLGLPFLARALGLGGLSALTASGARAAAQDAKPKWCPSPWGSTDERGAVNRITAVKVQEATKLIRQGKIYELGRVYERDMPLFGTRHFSLTIPQTYGPAGDNKVTWLDELVSAEIGQIGTQLDGLGHIGEGDLFYNCFRAHQFVRPGGLEKLGIEKVGVFFTRGVLADVAGFKGVQRLERGYEITLADLRGTLDRQKVKIREGDIVLFHTGWGSLWKVDNARYRDGEPGIGMEAGKWLVDHKVVLLGADNWAVEVVPNPNVKLAFPVHQLTITQNGIYLHENLDVSALVRDKVYEFAYVYAPLKLKGATGSPGNPIAVV